MNPADRDRQRRAVKRIRRIYTLDMALQLLPVAIVVLGALCLCGGYLLLR